MKEVVISPMAFHSYFRLKRQLLIATFSDLVQRTAGVLEPRLATEQDPVIRHLRRIGAFYGRRHLLGSQSTGAGSG